MQTAALYFVLAATWIIFSDRIIADIAHDADALVLLQTYKGLFFVSMTTLLLYFLLRTRLLKTESEQEKRIQSEKELNESEQRFRLLFERAPLGYQSLNEHGCIVDVNSAWLDTLGYSREEVMGKWFGDFLIPEQQEAFRQRFETFKSRGRVHTEFSMKKKDGNIADVIFDGRIGSDSHGHFKQTHCILNDVTEEKKFRESLIQSEERLRLSLKAANQGLFDLNVQTGETIVSPEYATMLGYDAATFVETNAAWIERLHPDDRENVAQHYREYVAGRIPEYKIEFRQRTRSGEWKWILSIGKIVQFDKQGHPLRMLGTHTDITERVFAEQRLKEQLVELQRWHTATLGREQRIMELKSEINALLEQAGLPHRYRHVQQGDERNE